MVSLLLTLNKYTESGVLCFSIHHFYVLIYKQSSLLNRVNYNFAICANLSNKRCQRALEGASVSTWHVNVPNDVPMFHVRVQMCQKACQFFKHSSHEMLREISRFYYITNSTLYLISHYTYCMYMYRT